MKSLFMNLKHSISNSASLSLNFLYNKDQIGQKL